MKSRIIDPRQEKDRTEHASQDEVVSVRPALNSTATKNKLNKLMTDFASFDDVMRIGTRQRREKDEHRLAEMKQEVQRLEQALDAEVKKRIEINKSLQHYCDEQIKLMHDRFQDVLDARTAQVSDRLNILTQELSSLKQLVLEEKHKIPKYIENKTNDLMQKLAAFMEAFDAERVRRLEHEELILKRLSEHEHLTSETFDKERRDREIKYSSLKASLDAYTSSRERGEETFRSFLQDEVAKLQNALVTEAQDREREDDEIIDALNRYTEKLQDSLKTITSSEV